MLSEELDSVVKIVKQAAKEISFLYTKEPEISYKKDGSPLTIADKVVEKILFAGLRKYGYEIISEETDIKKVSTSVKNKVSNEKMWIIDPLDGTKDFIEKTGEFAIMVGMIKKGKPVTGVVYQPISEKLYFAQKEKGAYLQEKKSAPKRLKVSDTNELSEAKFIASRHHTSPKEKAFMEKCSRFNIQYMGSIGLKLGLIAEGKADVYINMSDRTHQWDTCAPEVIIKEAGGNITDMEGRALKYGLKEGRNFNGVVAGNKIIHSKIINTLKKQLEL